MASNGQKSSKKHSRNFRVRNSGSRSTGSTSRYMGGKGPELHAARAARNCGCGKSVNHIEKNRAEHEREKQLKAKALREERGLSTRPRGKRGPAQQPNQKAIAAAAATEKATRDENAKLLVTLMQLGQSVA